MHHDTTHDLVFEATLRQQHLRFHTTWGLFSPTAIDSGSRLLIDHLTIDPADHTLDLSCGYGAIGLVVARLSPRGHVYLIDKDFVAVDYARRNAALNGIANVEIGLSNGFSAVAARSLDAVVANLPAQLGNTLLHTMIRDAADHLKPGGRLTVVTISRLKPFIKRSFVDVFGNYTKLKQSRMHTVSLAVKQEAA